MGVQGDWSSWRVKGGALAGVWGQRHHGTKVKDKPKIEKHGAAIKENECKQECETFRFCTTAQISPKIELKAKLKKSQKTVSLKKLKRCGLLNLKEKWKKL